MNKERKEICYPILEEGDNLALRDLRYNSVRDDLGTIIEVSPSASDENIFYIRTDKGYELKVLK